MQRMEKEKAEAAAARAVAAKEENEAVLAEQQAQWEQADVMQASQELDAANESGDAERIMRAREALTVEKNEAAAALALAER